MNFYELTQLMPNKNIQFNKEAPDPATDKNSYLRLISKLSQKLGEKSNKYSKLIRYVARDPEMLGLLEQLVEETSLAQQGTVRNIFKQ